MVNSPNSTNRFCDEERSAIYNALQPRTDEEQTAEGQAQAIAASAFQNLSRYPSGEELRARYHDFRDQLGRSSLYDIHSAGVRKGLLDAFHLALNQTPPNPHIIRYFIENGVNIHEENPDDKQFPLQRMLPGITTNDPHLNAKLEIVELLIQGGANVDAEDITGFSPLHHAAEKGWIRIAELLLLRGAKTESHLPRVGKTPLHIAVGRGNFEVAKLLIQRGAKVMAQRSFWGVASDVCCQCWTQGPCGAPHQ